MQKPIVENKPFSLHKRPTKNKRRKIYYCQFRDETGKYQTAISTRCTSKSAAEIWAWEQVYNFKNGTQIQLRRITVEEYSLDWWIWDKCQYIKSRHALGYSLTKGYAKISRRNLDLHILPYFKNKNLSDIKKSDINDWIVYLKENSKLSPKSIANTISTFRIMLHEAVTKELISENPIQNDLRHTSIKKKRKGILELSEVKKLFDPENIGTVWNNNFLYYTINAVACSTGMRNGECRALRVQAIHDSYVEVLYTVEGRGKDLKEPKNQSDRFIPIPEKIHGLFTTCIQTFTKGNPDDFIFSMNGGQDPISADALSNNFYTALATIGIDEQERKERNITFHSWRYFFNTYCRGKIPDSKLQQLTGHSSQEMVSHYTRFKSQDFDEVRRLQNVIF